MSTAEYQRSYAAERRDHYRQLNAEWRERNPFYHAASNAVRSQKKHGIEPLVRLSPDVFERVASGPCFDCGVMPAGGADHIVPFCQGGTNTEENLQPACLPCNQRKSARDRDGRKVVIS